MLPRFLSYLLPIKVESLASETSQNLKLYYYQGQYMLCTKKACYSYGTRYNPFLRAFNYYVTQQWPLPQRMLLLGGAMLSAVQILKQIHKHTQVVTDVVEIDAQCINIAKKYLPKNILANTNMICNDGQAYIAASEAIPQYNCIAVDLFVELDIPDFATEDTFLKKLKLMLLPNGKLIYNAYFADAQKLNQLLNNLTKHFAIDVQLQHQTNIIIIAQ